LESGARSRRAPLAISQSTYGFFRKLFFFKLFSDSAYTKREKKEKEEGKRKRKNKKPNWKQNQIEPVQYDCRENRFGLNGLDEWTRIVNMIDSK